VSASVSDGDGGSGTGHVDVTVANVAPTVTFSAPTGLAGPLAFTPFSGSFTDPGLLDSWVVSFLFDGVADSALAPPQSFPAGPNPHNFSTLHQYTSPGCNKQASAKSTDNDGGVGTKSITLQVGTGAFLPPMTNQPVTDKLRGNQVLPVKVKITDCSGALQTTLQPAIRLVQGDQTTTYDDTIADITIPGSVSAADSNGVMRPNGDGTYIYNMSVASAAGKGDFTVIVYPYGFSTGGITLRHVITITK